MPNTLNNDNVSDDFNDGDDGDNGDEDSERYQSIKMGKRKSFNENLENKDELASIINKIVTDMSHTWRLGALNVHCSLMRIIQSNNEDAIRTEFWNSTCEYNRNYFDGYFRGVYGNRINGKTKLQKTWKLDQAIIKFCRKHKVIEKNAIGYGNIFTYVTRKYFTNFMMCIIRSLYNNVRAYLNHCVISEELANHPKSNDSVASTSRAKTPPPPQKCRTLKQIRKANYQLITNRYLFSDEAENEKAKTKT
ncbi:uncharacterized protein LOC116347499 [Contarinia nasturtii]|uniref:uncharacterized protein LOC116347499 n=1 Tax=Contarinia nasturtii TaxID=265458 RepID=UPI0012D37376|nr:uncharacterized protein LOC116347499 [Contarinia nasturtii]